MKPINNQKSTLKLDDIRQALLAKIDEALTKPSALLSAIKIEYDPKDIYEDMYKDVKKPQVFFSLKAWTKMCALTENCNKEIAAHGIVQRLKHQFLIKDILVYPQLIAGTTVESDDDEYAAWLSALSTDVINSMRFQFHSHVNMVSTPSSVDIEHQMQMLSSIKDYYIFMIFNKRHEAWINIYDYESGILFEQQDITIQVLLENKETLELWYEKNKDMLKQQRYVPPVSTYQDDLDSYLNGRYPYEPSQTTRVLKSKHY